jgi:hypothetical protein
MVCFRPTGTDDLDNRLLEGTGLALWHLGTFSDVLASWLPREQLELSAWRVLFGGIMVLWYS